MEFSGENTRDSLISGDNNTLWTSLRDMLKQLLEGTTFSLTFRSHLTYILGAKNKKI